MISARTTFYLEIINLTQDAIGSHTESREIVRKFKGHITSIFGKENIHYDKEVLKASKAIICEYFSPIDESYQIREGSTIYDIKYVDNVDELNKQMKIFVEERK